MSPFLRPLLFLAITAFGAPAAAAPAADDSGQDVYAELAALEARVAAIGFRLTTANVGWCPVRQAQFGWIWGDPRLYDDTRSEEHTSELQSLMRISYAVFCLKKK